MHPKLPVFFFLMASLAVALALEPAEFKSMRDARCFAGNEKTDPKAPGGYGASGNLPEQLKRGEQADDEDVYLEILSKETPYGKYEGLTIRLINGGKKEVGISAEDSRIPLVQEALDKNGQWKEIEYLPSSWCGNSYHSVYLKPNHYWEFVVPKYSGPFQTSLRFKLEFTPTKTIYSLPYRGGVFPKQFKKPKEV